MSERMTKIRKPTVINTFWNMMQAMSLALDTLKEQEGDNIAIEISDQETDETTAYLVCSKDPVLSATLKSIIECWEDNKEKLK